MELNNCLFIPRPSLTANNRDQQQREPVKRTGKTKVAAKQLKSSKAQLPSFGKNSVCDYRTTQFHV